MSLNVLWRSSLAAKLIPQKQDQLNSDIKLIIETDSEKAKAHLNWYEVLVDGAPDESLLDAANLRHVIVPYVGIAEKLRQAILERPHITLHNSHFNDAFVAQHALALMFACSNRIVQADRALRQGDWTGGTETFESVFLPGKTCLLLGYGAIGRELEWRLKGLGMNATAYRRQPQANSSVKEYGPAELYEALAQADVVIVSLPLTPETRGLLNASAFAAMKTGSILVNVGRGDVIDEKALYEALKADKIFAAGIDVWYSYPKGKEARQGTLPANRAFHELPNVVMSPHRANQYQDWELVSFEDVCKTLVSLLHGEKRNLVDPERGY